MNESQQKTEIAGLYNRASANFDQVGPPIFATLGRALVEVMEIAPGARVLDVATGRGAGLFAAAEAVGPSGLAVGVDLAGSMLRQTSVAARQPGLERVRLAQMDAEHLGLPEGMFEAVLCCFAIFLLPAPEAALKEWRRVLKPGGRLGLTVAGPGDERWQWYDRLLVAYHERHGFPLSAAAPSRMREPAALQAALSAAGFVDVTLVTREFDFVWASAAEWWDNKWTHGPRYSLEHMAPAVLRQFKDEALAQLPPLRAGDGFHQQWRLVCVRGQRPAHAANAAT
jgi:ubiquinone/menaquinone biosynthesis C-methylase UbiE